MGRQTFSKMSAYIRLPMNLVAILFRYRLFVGHIGAQGYIFSIFVGVQAGYLAILSAFSNSEYPPLVQNCEHAQSELSENPPGLLAELSPQAPHPLESQSRTGVLVRVSLLNAPNYP
jgi:hypothetical protein